MVSVSSGGGERRLNINALVVEGRRLNASSGTQTRGSGEGKVGGGGGGGRVTLGKRLGPLNMTVITSRVRLEKVPREWCAASPSQIILV